MTLQETAKTKTAKGYADWPGPVFALDYSSSLTSAVLVVHHCPRRAPNLNSLTAYCNRTSLKSIQLAVILGERGYAELCTTSSYSQLLGNAFAILPYRSRSPAASAPV